MSELPAHGHHPVNAPTPVNGHITIADYDPAWPAMYAREEARIRRALGERALLGEHIGSPSVPGLAAKPIIDILLAVADVADEDAYLPSPEAAGYVLRIREPDPTSALFNDEEPHRVFKGSEIDLNLHVYSAGSGEIIRLLRMRDWLRTNDADRVLYERTKRALAARDWENVQQYAVAKDNVIAEIGARAATHAAQET
jgi:GrpB-like predicted nucleotidyltransferase (UPF0157 family)